MERKTWSAIYLSNKKFSKLLEHYKLYKYPEGTNLLSAAPKFFPWVVFPYVKPSPGKPNPLFSGFPISA